MLASGRAVATATPTSRSPSVGRHDSSGAGGRRQAPSTAASREAGDGQDRERGVVARVRVRHQGAGDRREAAGGQERDRTRGAGPPPPGTGRCPRGAGDGPGHVACCSGCRLRPPHLDPRRRGPTMTTQTVQRPLPPFRNEPVLELRRAPVRAQLADAVRAHDARGPLQVPVWVAGDTRDGDALVSTDPGVPDRVVARAAVASQAEVDAALDAAGAGHRDWGRRPAARARGGAGARRRLAARASPGGRRAGGAGVREALAGGGRRRLRGDRLPRVLRARRDRGRGGRGAAADARRAQHAELPAARRRRGDLAVELPRRDPVRDGGRRPGHRQRRRAQAGRAGARLRVRPGARAARGRRAAGRALAPPRRGRGRRRARARPARAHDRVHGLVPGRARRSCAPRPRRPPPRSTSSG